MPYSETLVALAFFATTFGIAYLAINARHRQRMAMIEKGMDMGSLRNREVPLRSLRNGLVMIGAGLGLFLGHLMSINMPTLNDEGRFEHSPLPYFIMVLLCSGLALVTHHFIARREEARKG